MAISPVILVTGASRGLGRGIAEELAKSGFSVAIHYSSNKQAAV
jgi:3-oxoacyl-[acyl-carrier protein] reductase